VVFIIKVFCEGSREQRIHANYSMHGNPIGELVEFFRIKGSGDDAILRFYSAWNS